MTSDEQTREDKSAQVTALNRQVRVLERKLTRSEENRARLEEAKDRFDTLYRNLIGELDEQKELLDEKNGMLESLSSKLSKYLAPQIYQSIFSGRQDVSLETKRKKLTVFFSDIKDFTQITEDLQAEDLAGLLNEYFTEMSKIALEHGATIDKFIGDAMLMFFGDPESKGLEDDAKACVQMAIAMQRRMRDLQEYWRDRGYEQPFRMRIGINTGFCNVGNFGSDDRMDYTIIGGEVNLAARLESQADPDGILLSYETYALVRDIVDAEERPSIDAKGIRREIRPFALGNFLDPSDGDRFIRCDGDGVSIRIDLQKLSDEDKRDTLEQLAEIMDRLRR
jgi:class 3 adenylate cyclase